MAFPDSSEFSCVHSACSNPFSPSLHLLSAKLQTRRQVVWLRSAELWLFYQTLYYIFKEWKNAFPTTADFGVSFLVILDNIYCHIFGWLIL